MTREWWRRNTVPLVAIVVLLPLTVGGVAIHEWGEWDFGKSSQPITAQPEESIAYAGGTIGPAKAEFTSNSAAPVGTRVVHATVRISPGDDPIRCQTPVLREMTGGERQWNDGSYELDVDYDPDRTNICSSETSTAYSLTLDYIVPDDASGPFVIELEALGAVPDSALLIIEP